ncbi:MAG: type II 3-dehydroquinate dehydratase [Fidelibacterota bacterium]
MKNILVINGPNLNLLGERNPEIYGHETLSDIEQYIITHPLAREVNIQCFQSNSEGDIINVIHESRGWAEGIIINPAAYTHYSYAIRDALEAVSIPVVEVHLSDITAREPFRAGSVIAPVCLAQVAGHGKESYIMGLKRLLAFSND